jgi:hypothetical protein
VAGRVTARGLDARERRRRGPGLLATSIVLLAALGAGHVLALAAAPALHSRMLPWIMGRGLGLAAYLALTAQVALGIWVRHPWRSRYAWPGPATQLRAHAALGAATVALVAGHVTSLALDRYAGVGWVGAFEPGRSGFRPAGVALGTVALYLLLMVTATAALAGSVARRVWFQVHRMALAVLGFAWAHGVLTGSDGHALRWVYVGSGTLVTTLLVTRWWARAVWHPVRPTPTT